MSSTPDVAIVGAGIVGAACARALSAEGMSVLVVDGAPAGSGTTAAGMGHIVAMDDSPAQLRLTTLSRELWADLAAQLPAAVEWDPCGTLWIAATDGEMAGASRRAQRYRAHGVDVELLDRAALAEAEPNLAPDLAGALRVPGDAVLYPPVAAQWMLDQAIDHGASFRRARVAGIGPGSIRVGDHETIAAGEVIDAAGVAALDLLDIEVEAPAIRPRKGHLIITDRQPALCCHQLIELDYLDSAHGDADSSVAFNLQPRITGQLLLGSSRQLGRDDRDVDLGMLARMTRRALRYVPALEHVSALRAWTGIRPATDDNLPIIDRAASGLVIAAGHEGLGITTATGTATLVTDLILDRPSRIDRAPYRLSRAATERHVA